MSARAGVLAPHTLATASPGLTGAVVAIGNFDGVHRGHTALLRTAMAVARERGLAALALTFEPHPRTIFKPEAPVFRLTPLPAKARILTAVGLDGLVVIPFDRTFSTLTADAFVEDILVDRLRIEGVAVGRDFHFGKGRGGSAATLAAHGRSLGFSVTVVDPVVGDSGETVSSSSIRDALAAGDVAMANDLLGHRWFVVGEVVTGDRRGRTLGFPTANIRLAADCRLRHGVYAVTLRRADGTDARRRCELRPPADLRRRTAASRGVRLRFLRGPLRGIGHRRVSRMAACRREVRVGGGTGRGDEAGRRRGDGDRGRGRAGKHA